MSYEVHAISQKTRYFSSNFFSISFLYYIFSLFFLFLIPLLVTYNSGYMWIKEMNIYEQPRQQYNYNLMTKMTYLDDQGSFKDYFYSTVPRINQLYDTDSIKVPIIFTEEVDENRDNVSEQLNLKVLISKDSSTNEKLVKFNTLIFFDTLIYNKKVNFESVLNIETSSMDSFQSVYIEGDSIIRQKYPIKNYAGYTSLYEPLIDLNQPVLSSDNFLFETILKENNKRNVSFNFNELTNMVTQNYNPDLSSSSTNDFYKIDIVLNNNYQNILVQTSLATLLKVFFIQYLSFFIVTYFIINIINNFVFKYQLVFSHSKADISYEKLD